MRDGRAGLGHPPWQGRGGGRGRGQAEACLQGGVEGFLKGSERPEAGQPRRITASMVLHSSYDYGMGPMQEISKRYDY